MRTGRPKVGKGSDVRVSFRVPSDERDSYLAEAKRVKMTVTAWIRSVLWLHNQSKE
jgi:hypothetical protein